MATELKDGISFQQLLNGGTCFEIDAERNDFADDIIYESDTSDVEEIDESKIERNPWQMSFEEVKRNMIPLSNFLYKKLVKEGREQVPKNAAVTVDYNAYFEGQEQTYDSTYMRGKPLRFRLGVGEVICGLEEAVLTMKRGEESQFIISYNLLYGENGCLPRIKPKADALFVIRLKDFKDVISAPDELTADNVEVTQFAEVYRKCIILDGEAKDAFRSENYSRAISQYKRAVQDLEYCRLKDENEEKLQREFLQKLYLNLAVCYNKIDRPKSTCNMINSLRGICDVNKHSKALYHEGKALRKIGEYDLARQRLKQAARLQPDDQNIIAEVHLLEDSAKKYSEEEKRLCANAFGVIAATNPLKKENASKTETLPSKEYEEHIQAFINSDTNELPIQGPLSDEVVAGIKSLEGLYPFKFIINHTSHGKDYKLKKTE